MNYFTGRLWRSFENQGMAIFVTYKRPVWYYQEGSPLLEEKFVWPVEELLSRSIFYYNSEDYII